jgi:monoamine oxidase
MLNEVDIAIVGAGAAGLAAAVALREAPVSAVVLEARDRIGGRGWTARVGGHPVDFGCGWLHSADVNPFCGLAGPLGFEIDRTPPHWMRQAHNIRFSPREQAQYRRALETLEERIEAAAAKGLDVAASTLMEPDCPWNPLLDAFSSYYNGDAFELISTLDYSAYEDSGVNWRVPRGYGALIAAAGAGVEVALETPVTCIDHGGARVRLATPRGELSARVVIVTVPTPLIAEGALAFTPELPRVREAAAALPLGLANKVFIHLDQPAMFEPETHLTGNPSRTETGSYHLLPFGRPMIEAFLGGAHARTLEAEGAGAASAFAIEELCELLGSSFRTKARAVAQTGWSSDPWSRGAYSHAQPGGAWARAALAEPVDGRIVFAGEAASAHAFSTAHGAADSGRAAARLALGALSPVQRNPLPAQPIA